MAASRQQAADSEILGESLMIDDWREQKEDSTTTDSIVPGMIGLRVSIILLCVTRQMGMVCSMQLRKDTRTRTHIRRHSSQHVPSAPL